MWLIFSVALIIRIMVAFVASHFMLPNVDYDTISYQVVGNFILHGSGIYPGVALGHFPYFPLVLYLEAFGVWLFGSGLKSDLIFRCIFSIFDALMVWPLYRLTHKPKISWMYAVNPVTILVTSLQGQFDAIPTLLLLWCIIFWEKRKLPWFYLFASLAITIKSWPALFLVPFVIKAKKLQSIIYLAAIPLMSIIIYCLLFRQSPIDVLIPVAGYRGLSGFWGLGLLIGRIFSSKYAVTGLSLILTLIIIFIAFKIRKADIRAQLIFLMLIFFVLTPTFGAQWLVWLVPFVLISELKYANLFLFSASLYLVSGYLPWFGVKIPPAINTIFSLLSWIILQFLLSEFVKNKPVRHKFAKIISPDLTAKKR